MTSSDPLLSFRFTLFDFFFSSVTAIVEKARLRPFFGGDMRGAGLLRVSGMLVMQERDSRTMQLNHATTLPPLSADVRKQRLEHARDASIPQEIELTRLEYLDRSQLLSESICNDVRRLRKSFSASGYVYDRRP